MKEQQVLAAMIAWTELFCKGVRDNGGIDLSDHPEAIAYALHTGMAFAKLYPALAGEVMAGVSPLLGANYVSGEDQDLSRIADIVKKAATL